MPRKKADPSKCSIESCERMAYAKNMCLPHYQRMRLYGRTDKKYRGDKRSHPLYSIWFERKQRGSLCETWSADFWAFVAAIGDRPSKTHLLRPVRFGEPYGPDNFEWLGALKREPAETRKAFNARKWQNRRERFPDYEADRNRKRKYGVTPENYGRMLEEQAGVCAICREDETRISPKTHAPQLLSVDHCHDTLRVRALLCWRCNTTIGKLNHDPELTRAVLAYLEAHAEK